MVQEGRLKITKGAHENRARPAIDPLFRSAAVAYGNRVIAVILTGSLDDGSAGMLAVRRCGGVCVIQDPADAVPPEMPRNVLKRLTPDEVVPLAQMGAVLGRLLAAPVKEDKPIPRDLPFETAIAERVSSDVSSTDAFGDQVPFSCPSCGGVLWGVAEAGCHHFRCHTGHAYNTEALLAEQSAKIEETLWTALRMFEERKNLLMNMSSRRGASSSARTRADECDIHISRLRAMLLRSDGEESND